MSEEYRRGWLDAAAAIEEPYAEEVFTPLSKTETVRVVQVMNTALPYASERMHAAWARHWARALRREVERADEPE